MQKWHIQLTIGRGRPVSVPPCFTCLLPPFRHQIHTSSPHSQDAVPDRVMPERTAPRPTRAQRQQASSKEVENLYYRHANIDQSITGNQNRSSQSTPSTRTRNGQPSFSFDHDVGVPLNKVLEGKMPHPKNPGDIYYRRPIPGIHRDGEVDAKKFDVRSRPRSDDGRFTMGRNGPVDARSLGARPQGLPEKPGSRNTRIAPAFTKSPREDARKAPAYSKSPREDTVGLAEKQRFPSPQHGSPSGPDSSQKGFSGDRPRRPRTSRNGEDGEPSRQPRDKNFAGGSSSKGSKRRARPVWNEEEKEYLEEKRISESERTVDFQPPNMTQATFSGVRPAVISGEEGMNEFLDEKLHLAKRYLQREFVQWQSKEQKSDVMTLVEALKGIDETGSSDPPHHALAEQQTQSLLQKLLGGQYEFTKHLLSKGALGDVSRYSGKNKTYFPEDEKSLLQKVQSLMPPDDPRKGGKNTQSAARA